MELDFSFFGFSPKPKEKKSSTPARLGARKLALTNSKHNKATDETTSLPTKADDSKCSGLRACDNRKNILAHENTIILDESTESFRGIKSQTYRYTANHETIVLSDSSDDFNCSSSSSSNLRLTAKKPPKVVIYSSSETSSSRNSFQKNKGSLRYVDKIILESSSEIEDGEPVVCDATIDEQNIRPQLSPDKERNINKWLSENVWNSFDESSSNYEGTKILEEEIATPVIESCPVKVKTDNNSSNPIDALMDELYGPVWKSAKKTTIPSSSESDDSFDIMMQKYMPNKENLPGASDTKSISSKENKRVEVLPLNRKLSYELDAPKSCMPPPKPVAKINNPSKPVIKSSKKDNSAISKPGSAVSSKVKAKQPLQPVSENSGLELRSFLESLSPLTPIPWCNPKALDFRNNFKTRKEELTKELYKLYNENVFESKLPSDMLIEWNVRLNKTAGYCYNRSCTNSRTGVVIRSSRIEISTKVCNTADRLRDTLIHELCHSANWILSGISNGHGTSWKAWAAAAMRRYKELPVIARCHSYKIDTKYTYKCTVCGYSIHRHSKSLDVDAKRCGYCRGTFELLVNSTRTPKHGNMPVARTPKAPSGFALYVKENYSAVKKNQIKLKHADVMKLLSQQFSATKISN